MDPAVHQPVYQQRTKSLHLSLRPTGGQRELMKTWHEGPDMAALPKGLRMNLSA